MSLREQNKRDFQYSLPGVATNRIVDGCITSEKDITYQSNANARAFFSAEKSDSAQQTYGYFTEGKRKILYEAGAIPLVPGTRIFLAEAGESLEYIVESISSVKKCSVANIRRVPR